MKVKIPCQLFISAAFWMALCGGAQRAWAAAATTTTLAITSSGSTVTKVAPGSVVTLTATVKAAGAAVTTGQVNFCDATAAHCTDIHRLGVEQLTSAGTAVLKFHPGIGSLRYKAVFLGTHIDAASSSSASALTVGGKYPTTTTIGQSGSAGDWTLTATVVGTKWLASPTGAVSFLDTGNADAVLGVATLGEGVAALNWTNRQTQVPVAGSAFVAIGDFNGDGIPDLAVPNSQYNTVTILLGNGDGTFTVASTVTFDALSSIAVGDFNGDGIPDLAVPNSQYNTVTILLGNGDGTFTERGWASAGYYPTSIVVGDFNGDGVPDLAATSYYSNTVTILLGNGDGTFTEAPVSPATGENPTSIAVGDFNGDGIPDLAVPNSGDDTVTILLGNGDGTFTAAASPKTGNHPSAIAVGDFNGDGKADLAVANLNSDTLTILLGKGDGTFTAAASPATGNGPSSLAVGDFNGGGIPDLAVANNDGTTTVLLGKGDGTFAASPAPGVNFTSIVVGDFNGDGEADLAGAASGSGNYSLATVLLSDVTETATATAKGISPVGLGAHEVEASYPGDGRYNSSVSDKTVLFVQTQTHAPTPKTTTTTLAVTLAGAPVTSVAPGSIVTLTATVKAGAKPLYTGQVNFCDATAAHCTDVHLLGAAQLTSAGTAVLEFRPGIGSHGYKAVFKGTNDDAASSSSAVALNVTGRYPTRTMIAQRGVAGNYTLTATVSGSMDKVGQTSLTGIVSFLDTTNGNSLLGTAALGTAASGWLNSQTPATGNSPDSVAVGDFNRDGIPDLVVTDANDSIVTILLGNGDGTFRYAPSAAAALNDAPNFVAVGDFNGDGILDLAVATSGNYEDSPGAVTILLGNGDGTFTAVAASPATGVYPQAVAVGDFNGDGIPDLAVANYSSNTLTILLGNGDGTFTAAASPATGGGPYSVAVGDFNGDGKADLAVANSGSNTLTILLGNGDGTFKAAASPATGRAPASVVVGDFNGDGKADLAVANSSSDTVTILLGKGDGTFTAAAASPSTGSTPASMAVGDFDGDGKADLAVANLYSNTVTILLGNGDGTFTPAAASPATGANPFYVAVGDFNGDGISDLAVANFTASTVTVLLAEELTTTATASGISPVGPGPHLVEASYSGNSRYSASVSGTTGLNGSAATPVFSPAAGTYPSEQGVTITDATTGATIYYTTNGKVPTTSSRQYAGGILVSSTETLEAIAVATNYLQSFVASAVYTIAPPAAAPAFKPAAGAYSSAQSVTITDATPGATIYYTTDGSTPAASSTEYTGAVRVSSTETLEAIAVATNYSPSAVATAVYTITAHATATVLAVTSGGSAVSTVTSGSVVTLTATVKAGSTAVKTGQVNFCDATAKHCTDIHLLGREQLTSAGTATFKFVPGIGSHSYKAVFVGTINDPASSSSATALTVTTTGKYPTATAIRESGSAGKYTLTATVTAYVDKTGQASPTGKVSFLDTSNRNVVLATAALAAGAPGLGFGTPPNPQAPLLTPVFVAVADFNGDGIPDLAVANYIGFGGCVTILLGNGDGTFTMVAGPGTGYYPDSIAVGDFNGDGIPDLAVADNGDSAVSILLGNGDGTFNYTKFSPATGLSPRSVAVGDFNGDGKADLAVANSGSNTVTVLLGNGDGTFKATAVSPATGSYPWAIAVGDFNGDGKADLAVVNQNNGNAGTVTILLGNGDGTFKATSVSPATGRGPQSVAVGDFNGDGIPDLAVANTGDNTVTILLGKGDGTFKATSVSPATGSSPLSVAVGDFNGDGIPDLAVANAGDNTVTILLGNGDGTFTAAASPATGHSPQSVAVADFNGDGIPDLAVPNYNDQTVTVLLTEDLPAVATASGISFGGSGTHKVEASYPGDGSYSSSVSGAITLPPPTATPVFSPAAGTYTSAQTVTIAEATTGATIYYTTNGKVPSTSSTKYTGVIPVSSTETLEAIAVAANYSQSAPATAVYTITTATPVFSPAAGAYTSAQTVTITDATTGATIYCTTNGKAPSTSSTKYTGAITVDSTETLEAIAVAKNYPQSALATAVYTITTAATPVFSPAAGTYSSAQSVTITDVTPGATIYYTTNGTVPTTSSKKYTGAIRASSTETLEAIAVAAHYIQSAVASAVYVITPVVSLSPVSLTFPAQQVGTSSSAKSVTLKNTGSAVLTITSIKASGDFSQTNTCGSSVAAGASCTLKVTFKPTATGTRTGVVTLTDNASSSPQTVSLTGTGVNPVPKLSALSPSSVTAGGTAFTLTVTGTNFVSTSTVEWNGYSWLTTKYVSGTQLTASVPAIDIATKGTATVTVVNPGPGGGTSSRLTFTIK